MGADFIFVAVPIGCTREEALTNLNALSDEQIIERLEFGVYCYEYFEEFYHFDEDDKPISVNRETLMPVLVKAVNTTYDVFEGRYRSGGFYQVDGARFAMCGGMSWGDPPDHYDELCVTNELQVTVDRSKRLMWIDA